MPKLLTEEAVRRYREDGYCFPVRVMSAEEAASCRRKLEAYEASQGGNIRGHKGQKTHLLLTWMADLVRHPKILDAVEDVLGPDILCWQTTFFIKNAKDPGYVSWHQDSTYWGLSTPDVVTAWVAFSPSNLTSGCMRVAPGTHKLDQLPHSDTFDENNLLTRGQELAVAVDESSAVDIILQPGEISLHHVRLAHASAPNRSDDRRIGLAIRYVAPHVRQVTGVPDSAMLVRGEDRHGNFAPETPPRADMDPAAIAEHARILNTRDGFLYRGAQGQPAAR